MICVGDKKAKLYHGDYGPAQFYKGDVKIAGYTDAEKVGTSICGVNTYHDKLNPTIEGKSEQTVTMQSANLCPRDWSKWVLSGGAFIDLEGFCVLPNMNSKATVTIRWDKAASYFLLSLAAEPGFYMNLAYLSADGKQLSCNGWCSLSPIREVGRFGGSSPTDNFYAKAISESTFIRLELSMQSEHMPNPFKFHEVCMQKRFDRVPDYIPFIPNSPSPDYPSPIRSSENFDVVSYGRDHATATTAHITDPLRSIGDVHDTIEVSDGKVEVIRRVENRRLTTSDMGIFRPDFYKNITYFEILKTSDDINRGSLGAIIPLLCEFAQYSDYRPSGFDDTSLTDKILTGGNNFYLVGFPHGTTDEQIKAKLANTNYLYALKTPTRTDITATPLGQAMLALRTAPGHTQVFTNAAVPPVLRVKMKEII